jgi:lipid A 3-O-deacylase
MRQLLPPFISRFRFTSLLLINLFLLTTVFLRNAAATTDISATPDPESGFLAITEENDSFGNPFGPHQDRHYTQGLKISLFGGDDFMTNASSRLNDLIYPFGFRPTAGDFGWIMLGQDIYTPTNLLQRGPIPTDRPYAGWLYTGAVYQRRGDIAPNLATMENFEINLGVVGPFSLAEPSQITIHHWLFGTNDIPKGWRNQLDNEPGLQLKYARLWRWSPIAATTNFFDLIPTAGGELGNVQIFATAGATMRLGYNLPKNFGIPLIDSPATVNGGLTRHTPPFYAYLFGGVDGRAVAHDITLDGNSFNDSGPSVHRNPFVADITWGFALQFCSHIEFSYTHVIRTEEFRHQDNADLFGSLDLKAKFAF